MTIDEYKQWLETATHKAYAELQKCEQEQEQRMGDVWYGRWQGLHTALEKAYTLPEDQT